MNKVTSMSVGHPTEVRRGLWSVTVGADRDYSLYFDVSDRIVESFYDCPALREALVGSIFEYETAVGQAYKTLQDHLAPEGTPAYSWSYGLITNLIRKQFIDEAAKP